ncbi:MAG: S1 family peptidase [Candidatus Electrothrix sp. YB6]
MAIEKEVVFLLTSAEGGKKAFGTGFAVAYQDGQLYLLTCAHVVDQLDDRIRVSGHEAEAIVVAKGAADGIDLALLRIPCEDPPPLLNRTAKGKAEKGFHICGYGPFSGAKNNYVLRHIEGRLGKSITFESPGSGRVEAWDLHVEDDDFSRLQGGYSGSPLCDEQGRLIAVVSHKVDAGQRGHAVAVANLKTIYPGIEQLIPSFAAPRPAASSADQVARAKKQLRGLLMDFDLDDSLCDVARNEFKQMEEQGIDSGDEELLEKIGNAYDEPDDWQALVSFLETLDKNVKNTAAGPDYPRLATQLARGEVILCLGQEISHLFGASAPSTAEIKKYLCEEEFLGPLSELCEQKLIAGNRTDLVNELRRLLDKENSSVALYDLLVGLEKPFIVISAAYDNLLQESLRAKRCDFVEIYPNLEEGKCLLIFSDGRETSCTPDDVSSQELLENGHIVIYRLRGGIVSGQEHLLLAERDYFAFNKVMEQQFPNYISSRMKSSLCSLWFIGHHPQSWEERLLVGFLKEQQHKDASSLAVQENAPPFNHDFWQYKGVKVHDLALADFVRELEAAL